MKHLQGTTTDRLFAFVLMAGLATGVAFAPVRAFAQEANPSAPVKSQADSHGQAGLPAQPGQEKAEEEEEHNVFRHNSLVQAISDAVFKDDKNATDPEQKARRDEHIEKTARTFEWVNSLILILCIVIPLAKILPKIIRRRSETLKQNLQEARKTTADANTRLSAVEAQLARLDEEIAQIRANVESESKQDEAKIKASIEEESARIVASAEQEIASASAQAQRALRHFAAELAIDNAARQLTLSPEADRALIAQFVNDANHNGASNGGAQGGKR
ncbi:ATP synthase F0 subunit B [Occallatibacter riparius]|uniref:ATP synthase subunit b n=1 Tax=Occallatibacter riparius TaxID=1002689 RepID=A0A9J7BS64_9BACT|nr:ATP synthase F0 subunit B [Occallatibacter riparius]UWZ83885.1 ATP synthase F0 subunit B [Occallatibacter riparius]